MSEIEIEPQKILKTAVLGGIVLLLASLFFMSWTDVNPGEEGFVYRPYTNGIDQENVYTSSFSQAKKTCLYLYPIYQRI